MRRAAAPYSALRHIASAIWMAYDPRRSYMTLFTAYFDASGKPTEPNRPRMASVLYLTGFVASVEKWAKFARKWSALLDEFGIEPPFHTTEFESGKGQFASWRDDAERRESFRFKAIDVIRLNTNKAFSFGVVVADLRRMFDEYEVPADQPREPYAWCGLKACTSVAHWAERRHKDGRGRSDDRFAFVFEDGDLHKGKLEDAIKKAFGKRPIFLPKDDTPAFQACDLVAWEYRNWLGTRTALGTAQKPPRPSVVQLARLLAPDSQWFADWASLQRDCEANGLPKLLTE